MYYYVPQHIKSIYRRAPVCPCNGLGACRAEQFRHQGTFKNKTTGRCLYRIIVLSAHHIYQTITMAFQNSNDVDAHGSTFIDGHGHHIFISQVTHTSNPGAQRPYLVLIFTNRLSQVKSCHPLLFQILLSIILARESSRYLFVARFLRDEEIIWRLYSNSLVDETFPVPEDASSCAGWEAPEKPRFA